MPKATFSQYRNLDIIGNNQFEAIILDVPGASGADKSLALKCQGFTMPGVTQGRLEVVVQGFKFYNSSGSTTFSGEFTINYFEDSDFSVMKTMRAWKEVAAGTESGTAGGNKSAYARDIVLRMYNPQGQPSGELTMFGCFPTVIPDLTAESTQTPGALTPSCSFSFDYHLLTGVSAR